jgi:hypothetical protein
MFRLARRGRRNGQATRGAIPEAPPVWSEESQGSTGPTADPDGPAEITSRQAQPGIATVPEPVPSGIFVCPATVILAVS